MEHKTDSSGGVCAFMSRLKARRKNKERALATSGHKRKDRNAAHHALTQTHEQVHRNATRTWHHGIPFAGHPHPVFKTDTNADDGKERLAALRTPTACGQLRPDAPPPSQTQPPTLRLQNCSRLKPRHFASSNVCLLGIGGRGFSFSPSGRRGCA